MFIIVVNYNHNSRHNKKIKYKMEQEYIKDDIVLYNNKIHIIIDILGLDNYELSGVKYPVNRTELSGVPLILISIAMIGY